jgi:DnaJ family protein A protein 2
MFFSNGFPGFFDMGGQGSGESPETDKEVENK